MEKSKVDFRWESLTSLSASTLQSLRELKFTHMTPVQVNTIPVFLKHKDVVVEAVTGSGKTLAFVIPIVEILLRLETQLKPTQVGAIILTPTRELAVQIHSVFVHFLKACSQLSTILLIGGTDAHQDIAAFNKQGGNIIIATPGRLGDLFQRKEASFDLARSVKTLEVLVLDEYDRLLHMGFEETITSILGMLPKLRRTGLFSATRTEDDKLLRVGLRNAVRVSVTEKKSCEGDELRTPSTLVNHYMMVDGSEKFSQLVHFLWQHQRDKMLLFFNTCACVDYFSLCLQRILKKLKVLSIHSKLKKKDQRNKICDKFRSLESGLLVCTNVMERGIDIPDVDWVIQYDPPDVSSSFVHRCGRTARIGNIGNALVLLMPNEDSYVKFLKLHHQVELIEMKKSEDAASVVERLRRLAVKDRAVYDKGMQAFVSFINSYTKHECSDIFRVKELDFGGLMTGYGLLKIPRMPELKGRKCESFQPVEVDINSIPYKDKVRETKRQALLQSGQVKKKKPHRPVETESWSKKKERKDRRRARQEKKAKKLAAQEEAAKSNKRSREEDGSDGDDFGADLRLMKKLKKGKISKEEFDKNFLGDEEGNVPEYNV